MRIVVTGATGNVGTSVLEALGRDARVEQIVGVVDPAAHRVGAGRRHATRSFRRSRTARSRSCCSRSASFGGEADDGRVIRELTARVQDGPVDLAEGVGR